MLVTALKQGMQTLKEDEHTRVWACVDEIDAALAKAGPQALLALNFIRAKHEERLAQLLMMQEGRIAHLANAGLEQNATLREAFTALELARATADKLTKRLARAKKKSEK